MTMIFMRCAAVSTDGAAGGDSLLGTVMDIIRMAGGSVTGLVS
jgi:hypothetical protein